MKVEMVVVAEDCALTSSDKTAGRRGLCGTVFIHKVLNVGSLPFSYFLMITVSRCNGRGREEPPRSGIRLSPGCFFNG